MSILREVVVIVIGNEEALELVIEMLGVGATAVECKAISSKA